MDIVIGFVRGGIVARLSNADSTFYKKEVEATLMKLIKSIALGDLKYVIGTINFTGNIPVIISHDGSSLGRFVCQ